MSGRSTSPPTDFSMSTWAVSLPLTVPNSPAEASLTVALSMVVPMWSRAVKVRCMRRLSPGARSLAPVRSVHVSVPVASLVESGAGVAEV